MDSSVMVKANMINELREKFISYRITLISNCHYGLMHLKIVGNLLKYFERNPSEKAGLCTIFFRITEDAHFDNFLSYLFRIFDSHKDALSIYKYINFIESNRNNLFVNNRDLIKQRIPKDKNSLNKKRNLLDKLREIRNKAHFHQDSKHAGRYTQIYQQNYIPVKELEGLIEMVLEMLDFYSNQFDGRKVSFDLEKYIKSDIEDLFNFISRGRGF